LANTSPVQLQHIRLRESADWIKESAPSSAQLAATIAIGLSSSSCGCEKQTNNHIFLEQHAAVIQMWAQKTGTL